MQNILGKIFKKSSRIAGYGFGLFAANAFLASTLLGGSTLSQNAQAQIPYATTNPELYIVMFRADWCTPCKVIEPIIYSALNSLNDPQIEYVTIDITTPSASEVSAHAAFDRNIVPQYNRWLGVTGFAALIDADTKQTLGCVNLLYDQNAMRNHIASLKNKAVSNQPNIDLTCPEPNNLG